MTVLLWILLIALIAVSISMVIVVMMQDAKSSGLGAAYGGNTDSFFGRNKSKTKEGKLVRMTKILGAALAIMSVAVVVILRVMV